MKFSAILTEILCKHVEETVIGFWIVDVFQEVLDLDRNTDSTCIIQTFNSYRRHGWRHAFPPPLPLTRAANGKRDGSNWKAV
jgi:hypothetical protein